MKKCAIIGSNGYIGKHIDSYLKQMGIIPECYDVHDITFESYTKIDLTDKFSIENINLNVDYIFLFAGLTGTHAGFDLYDKFISINEIGLLNLLDTIRKSPYRPKIIFPSTRLVYKGQDKPLKEEDEKETKTIYAVNKLACEGILQAYKASFDIPYTIFRICIPYGNISRKDYSYGLIGFFINKAMTENEITLYGNGDLKRTFTHVQDICHQMIQAAFNEKSNGEIYNIGGETYSLKEVALIISNKLSVNISNIPWPEKDLRIESNHTYFDDTKIKELLGVLTYKKICDMQL